MRRLFVLLALIASVLVVSHAPADAKPAYRNVRSKAKIVKVGRFKSAQVKCPRGTQVVSGGVEVAGGVLDAEGFALVASYPIDSRDRGKTPEDGWRVVVSNQSAAKRKVRAHAICAKDGTYFYGSTDKTVANGLSDGAALGCPDGATDAIVGGGARILASSNHPSLRLTGNGPIDTPILGDLDPDPDDFWHGTAHNASGTSFTLRVFSICERDLVYDYETFTLSFSGGTSGGSIPCARGTQRLVGGGGAMFAKPDLYMQQTLPIDSISVLDGLRYSAWHVFAHNDTAVLEDMDITSICRVL